MDDIKRNIRGKKERKKERKKENFKLSKTRMKKGQINEVA